MLYNQYVSPHSRFSSIGTPVHVRGPIAELLERLTAAMKFEGVPAATRIRIAEVRTNLFKLSNRHASPLISFIDVGGLPDPEIRPDIDDAIRDGGLSATLGAIWRISDWLDRLECTFGKPEDI